MRHRVAGRKLGRTTSHRQAMLRNLSTALIDKEKIITTLAKAKELRRFTEKLVTLSKKETLHARRRALRQVRDKKVVAKLFETLSARYSQRPGGYTRIIKLGPRRGDNAEMAVIEFVGAEVKAAKDEATETVETKPKTKRGRSRPKAEEAADQTPEKKTASRSKAKTTKAKTTKKKATVKKKTARKAKTTSTKKG